MVYIPVAATELPFPYGHRFFIFTGTTFPDLFFGSFPENFSLFFVPLILVTGTGIFEYSGTLLKRHEETLTEVMSRLYRRYIIWQSGRLPDTAGSRPAYPVRSSPSITLFYRPGTLYIFTYTI